MNDSVDTSMVGDFKAEIFYDIDPDSPRNWDNLGTLVTWSKDLIRIDESGGDFSPLHHLDPRDYVADRLPLDELKDWYHDRANDVAVAIYFNIGDVHGPGTVQWFEVEPFGNHGGCDGVIYVTNAKVMAEYGDVTGVTLHTVRSCLVGELDTYCQYANGEVYGFVVSRPVEWRPVDSADGDDTMTTWEEVESCWGFFGIKDARSEAIAIATAVQS